MLPREFLRENAARLLQELPERFSGAGLETYSELDGDRRRIRLPGAGQRAVAGDCADRRAARSAYRARGGTHLAQPSDTPVTRGRLGRVRV